MIVVFVVLVKSLLFGARMPLGSYFPKGVTKEVPENVRKLAKFQPLWFLISDFLISAKAVVEWSDSKLRLAFLFGG